MAQQGQVNFAIIARDAASKVLKNISGSIKSMAKTFVAIGAAASAAVAGISKFAQSAVHAAIADQEAQKKLVSVLEARGLATKENMDLITKQIAIAERYGKTDDEVRGSIETATQFTKDFSKAIAIQNVAFDLAAAKGMSLERATMLVGRAFSGNGAIFKRFGVDLTKVKQATDGSGKSTMVYLKGMKALGKITEGFGGIAEKMSRTTATRMESLRITFDELKESVGYAIGGGEDLPFFTEILDAVQPFVDQVAQTVRDNLPTITAYSRELKDKIIANLPKIAQWLKTNLPKMLTKAKELVTAVKDGVMWLVDALSTTGPVNAAIVALGAKFGGWKGAISGAFAAGFSAIGFDPLTSAIAGAIAGAFAGSIVEVAIGAFTKKIAIAIGTSTIASSISSQVIAGATASSGGFAAALVAGLPLALMVALQQVFPEYGTEGEKAITEQGDPTRPGSNVKYASDLKDIGQWISALFSGGITFREKPVDGAGIAPKPSLLNLRNDLTVNIDGKKVARVVNDYLGLQFNAGGDLRPQAR